MPVRLHAGIKANGKSIDRLYQPASVRSVMMPGSKLLFAWLLVAPRECHRDSFCHHFLLLHFSGVFAI